MILALAAIVAGVTTYTTAGRRYWQLWAGFTLTLLGVVGLGVCTR